LLIGVSLGVVAGFDEEVLVDGVPLEASSSLPQAAVTKSRERAEAARATRLVVWDMTIVLLRMDFLTSHCSPRFSWPCWVEISRR
jgi:hypothetical protein